MVKTLTMALNFLLVLVIVGGSIAVLLSPNLEDKGWRIILILGSLLAWIGFRKRGPRGWLLFSVGWGLIVFGGLKAGIITQ